MILTRQILAVPISSAACRQRLWNSSSARRHVAPVYRNSIPAIIICGWLKQSWAMSPSQQSAVHSSVDLGPTLVFCWASLAMGLGYDSIAVFWLRCGIKVCRSWSLHSYSPPNMGRIPQFPITGLWLRMSYLGLDWIDKLSFVGFLIHAKQHWRFGPNLSLGSPLVLKPSTTPKQTTSA